MEKFSPTSSEPQELEEAVAVASPEQDDAARNNEIVVQTSQFYGIDLVTLDGNKTLL